MKKLQRSHFTLIELLCVTAMIAFLAGNMDYPWYNVKENGIWDLRNVGGYGQ